GVPTCREGPVNVAGMVVAPRRRAGPPRRVAVPGSRVSMPDATRRAPRGGRRAHAHTRAGTNGRGAGLSGMYMQTHRPRTPRERTMQFGIFTVGDVTTHPPTGRTPDDTERVRPMRPLPQHADAAG